MRAKLAVLSCSFRAVLTRAQFHPADPFYFGATAGMILTFAALAIFR